MMRVCGLHNFNNTYYSYRLKGLDGEATEEMVETLTSAQETAARSDPEREFAVATVGCSVRGAVAASAARCVHRPSSGLTAPLR